MFDFQLELQSSDFLIGNFPKISFFCVYRLGYRYGQVGGFFGRRGAEQMPPFFSCPFYR
jgi:hypothetical protein